MLRALAHRDPAYDGLFLTAVRTTGVFCRPVCPARTPRSENVTFFATPAEAIRAGFRPCKRCRPLESAGAPPEWAKRLLAAIDADPSRRWRDEDLRERGLGPDRVRRWFRTHYGMTFHAYSRSRRLGLALGDIGKGSKVIDAAYETGYESLSGFQEALRQLTGTSARRAGARGARPVTRIETPLGSMVAAAAGDRVALLEFLDRRMLPAQLERLTRRVGGTFVPGTSPVLETLTRELQAYFAGRLERFTVPLLLAGTPFQESVWRALLAVPAGETRSYAEIAGAIGRPTAVRAVARANGDNRIAVLIPCHRVIGADGRLTGYGGGLWRKQRLLDLERGVRISEPE
jgi:AraC family transcriptional regulator of adaptative response/methylated-DNA-[protein]-cysteine methyltransferase